MDAEETNGHTVALVRTFGVWAIRTLGAIAVAGAIGWTGYVWDATQRIPSPERQARVVQHLDHEVPAMQANLVRLTAITETITALAVEREKSREKEYAEIMRRLERIERQTK